MSYDVKPAPEKPVLEIKHCPNPKCRSDDKCFLKCTPGTIRKRYYVECRKCGTHIAVNHAILKFVTPELAIGAWNSLTRSAFDFPPKKGDKA